MPTISQLNQRHPDCDSEVVGDCRALYEGGECFNKRIRRFLPQRSAEPGAQYEVRKAESHYQNYLGPIIDYFASMLFTSRAQPVAKRPNDNDPVTDPGDYYNEFRDDCDRTGTDIDSFFKDRFTRAMVDGTSWIRLHEPTTDNAPSDRAEFDKQKLGEIWVEAVCWDDVLDWEIDDNGNLIWAITHKKVTRREGPGAKRDQVTETWDYITLEDVETFEIRYHKDRPPGPETIVSTIGPPVPHRFERVPLFRISLPPGLWVSQRIASPQLAHFRLSNAQTWSLSRTCYAMPVFKVTEPDTFIQRMGAGIGITILPDEDVDWIAPPGEHFQALREEIKTHKDEIFRIAHQMAIGVDNNSQTIGRTAESKIADAQATRVMLIAFAKEVKEEMARIYDTISVSRGEEFTWTVGGLDEFITADLLGFLTALQLVNDKIGGIPSNTANIQIKTKLVEGLLPEIDQETRAKIRTEIEDGVNNQPDPAEQRINEAVQLHTALAQIDGTKPAAKGKASGAKPPKPPSGGSRRAATSTTKA